MLFLSFYFRRSERAVYNKTVISVAENVVVL